MNIRIHSLRRVLAAAVASLSLLAVAEPSARSAEPVRILAIGNSYSLQMTWELPPVLKALGVNAEVTAMYIGGCPFSIHAANLRSETGHPESKPYEVFRMGQPTRKGNILETLGREKWDVVTIQQASHESWKPETFADAEPLIAAIRQKAPQAKIVVHETWSYNRADSRIAGAGGYGPGAWGIDQAEMYRRLHANYAALAEKHGFEVIPVGTAVQRFRRECPDEIDVVGLAACGNQFDSKHMDSIHMNAAGSHLQALVWAETLFKTDVRRCAYVPPHVGPRLSALCRRVAHETVSGEAAAPAPGVSSFALDDIFADHMVLQRRKAIRFSGFAAPGAVVRVKMDGRSAAAYATPDGRWAVELPPMEAGGPYRVEVSLAMSPLSQPYTTLSLDDVMVGEVWLASGQSNMEFWVLGRNLVPGAFFHLPDGEAVAATKDPLLRLVCVPHGLSPDGPCAALPRGAKWRRADTREANGAMSAVAWMFGKNLREELDVPVGIIASSWGGTRIEPWTSEETVRFAIRTNDVAQLEAARAERVPFAESVDAAEDPAAKVRATFVAWRDRFFATDPKTTAEALANWTKPTLDDADWTRGKRDDLTGYRTPGVVWFRIVLDVPADWKGPALVYYDYIDDCDQTYLDGRLVGVTDSDMPNYWSTPRRYPLAELKPGRHVLAIRMQDHCNSGEFGNSMYVQNMETKAQIDLTELVWREKVEFKADLKKIGLRPLPCVFDTLSGGRLGVATPATLYNAMIAPITRMNIGGAIWYQGCANAGDPDIANYARLQKNLIADWRLHFRDLNLPFVLTQLAAFDRQTPAARLSDDFWMAQKKPSVCVGYGQFRLVQDACHTYPLTGVACAIDIGDHSDIHPANKREVGRRLAREALRITGLKDFLAPPRAVSAVREGSSVVVTVAPLGKGLSLGAEGTKFGPHLFALAGADGVFRWAEGELLADGRLRVSSKDVSDPQRVQYCVSGYPPNVTCRRTDDDIPLYPFELAVR